jgi:hypothetical protein
MGNGPLILIAGHPLASGDAAVTLGSPRDMGSATQRGKMGTRPPETCPGGRVEASPLASLTVT